MILEHLLQINSTVIQQKGMPDIRPLSISTMQICQTSYLHYVPLILGMFPSAKCCQKYAKPLKKAFKGYKKLHTNNDIWQAIIATHKSTSKSCTYKSEAAQQCYHGKVTIITYLIFQMFFVSSKIDKEK